MRDMLTLPGRASTPWRASVCIVFHPTSENVLMITFFYFFFSLSFILVCDNLLSLLLFIFCSLIILYCFFLFLFPALLFSFSYSSFPLPRSLFPLSSLLVNVFSCRLPLPLSLPPVLMSIFFPFSFPNLATFSPF